MCMSISLGDFTKAVHRYTNTSANSNTIDLYLLMLCRLKIMDFSISRSHGYIYVMKKVEEILYANQKNPDPTCLHGTPSISSSVFIYYSYPETCKYDGKINSCVEGYCLTFCT